MIYIITPFLSDFISVCEREGLRCPIQRGKPINEHILWVHHPMQLYGREIMKVDRVLWGELTDRFEEDTLNKIITEIEIRKKN